MTEGRSSTPFGAESTAAEVIEGIDLTGRQSDELRGVADYAIDPGNAARLWMISEDLLRR